MTQNNIAGYSLLYEKHSCYELIKILWYKFPFDLIPIIIHLPFCLWSIDDFMTRPFKVFWRLKTSSKALQRLTFCKYASCNWLYLRLIFSNFSYIRSRSSSNLKAFNLASICTVDLECSSSIKLWSFWRNSAFSWLKRIFWALAKYKEILKYKIAWNI